jgi:hypothetical protein
MHGADMMYLSLSSVAIDSCHKSRTKLDILIMNAPGNPNIWGDEEAMALV